MSLSGLPSQGNGLKGVYTTEEAPGTAAGRGRGVAGAEECWQGVAGAEECWQGVAGAEECWQAKRSQFSLASYWVGGCYLAERLLFRLTGH